MKSFFKHIFIGVIVGFLLLIGFNFINPSLTSSQKKSELLQLQNLVPLVVTDQQVYTLGDTVRGKVFLGVKPGLLPYKVSSEIYGVGEIMKSKNIWKVSGDCSNDNYYDKYGLKQDTLKVNYYFQWRGSWEREASDTVLTISKPYEYSKTTVQVRSGISYPLYRDCGNVLRILSPVLGDDFHPTYKIHGGTLTRSNRYSEEITIVPDSHIVDLEVYHDNVLLGMEKLKVKEVPLPQVVIYVGGKALSANQILEGVAEEQFYGLDVKVFADNDFRSTLPQEQRYRVTQGKLLLRRGGEVVLEDDFSSTLAYKKIVSSAKVGDSLTIEISEVTRYNYRKKKFTVPFSFRESITIK